MCLTVFDEATPEAGLWTLRIILFVWWLQVAAVFGIGVWLAARNGEWA